MLYTWNLYNIVHQLYCNLKIYEKFNITDKQMHIKTKNKKKMRALQNFSTF